MFPTLPVLPKRESDSSSSASGVESSSALYSERTLAASALSCALVSLVVGFAAGVLCSGFLRRKKEGGETGENNDRGRGPMSNFRAQDMQK